MKKILILIANILVCIGFADAAVRDGTSVSRTKSDKNIQSRISTIPVRTTVPRTTVIPPQSDASSSTARNTKTITRQQSKEASTPTASLTARTSNIQERKTTNRTAQKNSTVRAAVNLDTHTPNTRIGAEYEQCKNTYFSCMDQFCSLKNDDYRRCSCNDRVFELAAMRQTLQDAGEQLTIFTENLDVVGMTAAQATAMHTESDGETALKSDNSASKALLQAIMNSIRGEDSTVGGKYSDLNSINISFDTVNAFGTAETGQTIAAYDGVALYNAVYPQCRNAVRADCNDASLQRAITAYLMAIEQDCNTVRTAIEKTRQDMKAAIREGDAMLDLARIENRQKHNSSDITTCINAVEDAILSEEVCGANYHKCLDNGEFIDISTGQPIAGVENFYMLEKLLTFNFGVDAANQKLTQNSNNRGFIQNFENRVKKFAQPALDKCVEDADTVWAEYLDIAMLDIYYAQKSKVSEIKQNCFDYISACYMNSDAAITAALSDLNEDSNTALQPDAIALNKQMCTEYVTSCDNMFDGNIIAQYIENRTETDTLTACRAVAKQCFDKYGGTNYENFYYPYSGLFTVGKAPDWFTLYEYKSNENNIYEKQLGYKSECAKQLASINACNNPEIIEKAFGGLDYFTTAKQYGLLSHDQKIMQRYLRPTGVATEIYNNILSVLSTQCINVNGRFIEYQQLKPNIAQQQENLCKIKLTDETFSLYGLLKDENVCPRDYILNVDTESWGICSCWENGARRSKNGKSVKCMNVLPTLCYTKTGSDTCTAGLANDERCVIETGSNNSKTWQLFKPEDATTDQDAQDMITEYNWCTQTLLSNKNQICPLGYTNTKDCNDALNDIFIPKGID